MLGLYQRHTLKAFRASVGDEEGHDYFVTPKKINSRCSQAVGYSVFSMYYQDGSYPNLAP